MITRIAQSTLAVLALTVPAAAHAQAQDSTPPIIPAEFLDLLWGPGTMGAGRPELIVGLLPEQLATDLRPGAGVRVVGSVTSRVFGMGAIVVPGGRDAAREAWSAKLLAAGWVRQEQMQRPEGGFEQESPYQPSASFCSADDGMLSLATRRHRGDSTAVVFMLSGEAGMGSPCAPDPPSSGMMIRVESPAPILRAPEGAGQGRSGGGGGGGGWDSYTRLRTDMTPGELIGHYAPQFVEQGWQPVTQSLGEDVAIHVFRKTDDEGFAWHAVLSITLLENGERNLHLRLTQLERR
jgi:hypothetical protein